MEITSIDRTGNIDATEFPDGILSYSFATTGILDRVLPMSGDSHIMRFRDQDGFYLLKLGFTK